jgi:3-oxoacyl-[acyl-carrier-protein] synthase-1
MDRNMRKVWAIADSIVSPLGFSAEENYGRIKAGETAISDFAFDDDQDNIVKAAAIRNRTSFEGLTFFESICSIALDKLFARISLPRDRTLFILSTTKGNIDLLEREPESAERIKLYDTAVLLARRFGLQHVQVVSNACISGVLGLIVAKRFLQSNKYDHAVVLGADILSKFVVSGFRSLQALSSEPCRPFDAARNGISLGEAAAAMVLSAEPQKVAAEYTVAMTGEAVTNDANHISGPSRTGEELAAAIVSALNSARIRKADIDFISAHGTATVYNDEMEAKAFFVAGLEGVPLNSLKGYYGHTLGAAGVLESAISVRALLNNDLIGTAGFQTRGVSMPVKVAAKTQPYPLKRILKTASGFGGGNAAVVFEK